VDGRPWRPHGCLISPTPCHGKGLHRKMARNGAVINELAFKSTEYPTACPRRQLPSRPELALKELTALLERPGAASPRILSKARFIFDTALRVLARRNEFPIIFINGMARSRFRGSRRPGHSVALDRTLPSNHSWRAIHYTERSTSIQPAVRPAHAGGASLPCSPRAFPLSHDRPKHLDPHPGRDPRRFHLRL